MDIGHLTRSSGLSDYDNFALFNGPILPTKQGINIPEDWRTTWYF